MAAAMSNELTFGPSGDADPNHLTEIPTGEGKGWPHRLSALGILLRTAPVMACLLNEQGVVLQVNRRWVEGTGHSSDAAAGRPMADFLSAESRRWGMRDLLPALASVGRVTSMGIELSTAVGGTLPVLVDGLTLASNDGRWTAALALRIGYATDERRSALQTLELLAEASRELAVGPAHAPAGVTANRIDIVPDEAQQTIQAFLETFRDIAGRLAEVAKGQRELLDGNSAQQTESTLALKGIERALLRISDRDGRHAT